MNAAIPSPAAAAGVARPAGARVTIVMTARERYSLTERALESIVRNTRGAYRLIFADAEAPEALRQRLAARAGEWNLELVRAEGTPWPNELRRRVAADVDTDYVVFIDNDVVVEPGWLDALVECADATGAGVVGPLYLIGDGASAGHVHMAGGDLTRLESTSGTVLQEMHRDQDADPAAIAANATRRQCDFVEYHCLLMRAELARDGALFDPDIVCVHEHIDLSLGAKERGYATWTEPAARVTYLGHAEWACDEVALRRRRWAYAAGQASIAAFCRKWQVVDDESSFGWVRHFLREHVRKVDPLRPESAGLPEQALPMDFSALPQSRSALLDLAQRRGYTGPELAFLGQAYQLAATLVDGGYRPCGRPFISHLVGTAGVLAHYGFRVEVVAAGLLHAAYTHCPQLPTGPQSSIDAVCATLGGRESSLERRVRAYTRRGSDLARLAPGAGAEPRLPVPDGEIVAIAAANEIDMLVSGEFRYSGRSDALKPAAVDLVERVCRQLGVPGLAQTLRNASAGQAPVPAELQTRIGGSYRIAGYNLVPLTNDAFFRLDQG